MLTTEEREALKAVKNGGDVFSHRSAKILRSLEKRGLVSITAVMGDYPGEGRFPYFGAIATAEGKKHLRQPAV